jgi:hypothetical protein
MAPLFAQGLLIAVSMCTAHLQDFSQCINISEKLLANNLRDQTLAKKWKLKNKNKNRPILEQMAKVMRKITSPRTTQFP